ncbi:E3 SUMO-protein ligase ZBED1-like [Siphateles boraxobius]|uniref:E3 SUMO-protein ligase ZBED1-like n=1 Tax=Siphateles boraxobius TaxID=180520 RepID=UPI004063D772
MSSSMRPYSLVEEPGFKYLLHVLEPRYNMPSRTHMRQTVVPSIYNQTRTLMEHELSAAPSVSLTTDGWTSRATESYLTVTAHFIDSDWKMKASVLQTRPLYEQHTSTLLAEKLQEVVAEWKLERPGKTISVTTDNAKNIVNAVREAGLGPHVACFAHFLNLAAQKALAVNQVSRLLGKIRKIVTFFHRSTTAAYVLERKQLALDLPKHSLIHDVSTRWNSSYEMVERYLEQQVAIYSALTDNSVKNKQDGSRLSDQEVSFAESVVRIMKPLKTITTILSTETTPSVSMILPLKTMIMKSMEQNDDDAPIVREMKNAIRENLQIRYIDPDLQDFFNKCTALDPRFKSLPHLDPAHHQNVFDAFIAEVMSRTEQIETETTQDRPSTSQATSFAEMPESETSSSPPPPKKSAMAEVFGSLFATSQMDHTDLKQKVKEEVHAYIAKESTSLESDPLDWWRSNETIFPNLAKLAKCYLAVPATSVPSERVFSKAGDIVIATRSTLTSESVDILVFLKKNLKIQ